MTHNLIEIRALCKTYRDRKGREVKKALHGVNLDLHRGEIFGLLGVNGAGKTTLASIMATRHPPTSGDVLWQGKSIYRQLSAYRQIIGLCPQTPNIEKRLNIEENLVFVGTCYGLDKKSARKEAHALIEQFDLGEYVHAEIDDLSGGYRQRFLIARALVHKPELVILDEPTVGLDPHIRRELWEVIRALKARNITVVLTTHYLDEAEYLSDRVCLLHAGLMRTVDTPENLKKLHQKNSLEEVFLKFVDDPNSEIFKAATTES